MELNLDPIYMVNLMLCLIILVLGYLSYKKSKDLKLTVGITSPVLIWL